MKPVDGVHSRRHRALDQQIDCHDRVQVTINAGEFIQARLACEGYCVVGCDSADVVVKERVCRTKHRPAVFYSGTLPKGVDLASGEIYPLAILARSSA